MHVQCRELCLCTIQLVLVQRLQDAGSNNCWAHSNVCERAGGRRLRRGAEAAVAGSMFVGCLVEQLR